MKCWGVLESRGASPRPQLVGVSQFCLGSPHGEIKRRRQLLPVTVLNAGKDLLNRHDNQSFSLSRLGKLRLSSQDWTARKGGAGFTFGWSKPRARSLGLCTLQLSCSFFLLDSSLLLFILGFSLILADLKFFKGERYFLYNCFLLNDGRSLSLVCSTVTMPWCPSASTAQMVASWKLAFNFNSR